MRLEIFLNSQGSFFIINFIFTKMERTISSETVEKVGEKVLLKGWLHTLRLLGNINFLILRDRGGLIQVVVEEGKELDKVKDLQPGSVLKITGEVQKAEQTELGAEIINPEFEILEEVTEPTPVEFNKPDINAEFSTILDNRTTTLRNIKQQAIFKIQAAVKEGFRKHMVENGFIEFSSPKILAEASEGGSEVFKFEYFHGKSAFLAQSPQFYKQIMVGVFERVFETGPVYRAEKSNTSRHMSEYVSLDAEMGFIEHWHEIIELIDGTIKAIIEHVWKTCEKELKLLKAEKPITTKETPVMTIDEIHEIFFKETGEDTRGEPDLSPDEEKFICEYAAKNLGSDLVFATHYPWSKRPFYTKRSEENPEKTNSTDLLFRGVEIVTGGQRENRYSVLLEQAKEKNVDVNKIQGYLEAFKYGMPAEGGFGMGSERVTQKIIGLSNVKEATLFPRDIERLTP